MGQRKYLCLASFPLCLVSSALGVHHLYSLHSQDNIVQLVNHVSDTCRKAVHQFPPYVQPFRIGRSRGYLHLVAKLSCLGPLMRTNYSCGVRNRPHYCRGGFIKVLPISCSSPIENAHLVSKLLNAKTLLHTQVGVRYQVCKRVRYED